MNNKSGFSLLEVLVAASIMSVIILGVMKVNDNLISVEQGFHQTQDALEILSNAKLFMGHQVSCMGVFKQAKKKRSDGKQYIPISGDFDSIKNFSGTDFLGVGDRYGKLEVLDMRFEPRKGYFEADSFDNERGIINVFIVLQGYGRLKRLKTKILPVWVYAHKEPNQSAEIQYCDSSRSDMVNYITESVMARVCSSLDAVLDPESRLCLFGTEEQKRKAIKAAKESSQKPKREISSSPSQVDENAMLMFLMKSLMKEDEKKGDQ